MTISVTETGGTQRTFSVFDIALIYTAGSGASILTKDNVRYPVVETKAILKAALLPYVLDVTQTDGKSPLIPHSNIQSIERLDDGTATIILKHSQRRLVLTDTYAVITAAFADAVRGDSALIGEVKGVDLDAATNDNPIAIPLGKYIVRRVVVTNASTSLAASPATLGVFTGAGGTGTTIVTPATLTTLTTAAKFVDMTLALTDESVAATTLYVRTVVAHGSAATADVYIFGEVLP